MSLKLSRGFSKLIQKSSVLSEAERAVGYPTSFLSLRWILNDEVANIAVHIRKLIGTQHPLLQTAKRLLLRNELTWGLVVLLITKTAGINNQNYTFNDLEYDRTAGILHSQRVIAEVLEMIKTSHLIHKGLVNLKNKDEPNYSDLHYGNKIALLGGDYLLSKSFHELAVLGNNKVQQIISISLRDLSEGEFLGIRDEQNHPLPSKPNSDQCDITPIRDKLAPYQISKYMGNMKAEWILRNILNGGSLLGCCCWCNMVLAHHNDHIQDIAYKLGENFALLNSLIKEKKAFENGENFSLVSAPVMLHLQHDPFFYKEIEKGLVSVNLVDYNSIKRAIYAGPALEKTDNLIREYSRKTIELLDNFKECDSKRALVNIIKSL